MLFWGTESTIQGHSGLGECSSAGDGVKSLCADGESLEQVRCFPRIAGDGGHAATQLCQELAACAVDGAQRFDSHRDKIVSGRKVRIFGSFSVRCMLALLRLQALPTSGGYRRPRTCGRLLRPKKHTCPSPKEREWLRPVFCRRFGSGLVVPSSLGRPLSPGLSRLYPSPPSDEQLYPSIACKPARGDLLNLPSHRSGIGVGHRVRVLFGVQLLPARPHCSGPSRTRPLEPSGASPQSVAMTPRQALPRLLCRCLTTTLQP